MNDLIITNSLALPEETVVSKVGIVGMSGSGKTQTARKLAEAMLSIDQHIAVLDPTGAWWGLRSSADGLDVGFPIVVFGGPQGDAPLRFDAGAMLGQSLVKERFNAIFDMSKLNDSEIRRFSTDFLNAVYIRNRHPLHIFMDEFDIICPQAKAANSEEARAAVNTTVRRGRLKGIGSTMITQNPQDADKSVLNMADTVIAMRTQGSQAIDAIGKWMGRNLAKPQLAELVSTLPELKTGAGWIHPTVFIEKLIEVFREVRRVLRSDGTCWVNMGDSYANDGKWGGHTGGKHVRAARTTGWRPQCACGSIVTRPVVLDPFSGSGTTGLVAVANRRKFIGIELNPEYAAISVRRLDVATAQAVLV